MSQVAVLPHQTNGASAVDPAASASTSQPDIGQLSLHAHHPHHHYVGHHQGHSAAAHAVARRKSSFSSSGSNSSTSHHNASYRTMPLSRTRSLLANINGVANGANGSIVNGLTNGSSTANTPGSEANGYGPAGALPSINGSSDHLPPLKANLASNGSNTVVTNGSSSVNNNKFFNGGTNGVNGSSLTNGYLHHDMDVISTTGSASLQSGTNSLTNGHLSHMNGMQTLPHVRSSGGSSEATTSRQIMGYGSEEIPDKDLFDNDKSQAGQVVNSQVTAQQSVSTGQTSAVLPSSSVVSQAVSQSQAAGQSSGQQAVNQGQQQQQTVQPSSQSSSSQRQSVQDSNPQNSVQHSPTNSSALSNNAVNAANNTGSLKPKTMVATPEQVSFHLGS